ncbi:MAG: hypothetical protein ACRCYU_19990, partial [Nocardioides sp.]
MSTAPAISETARSRLTATPENRRRNPLLAAAWWVLFGAGVSGLGSSILGLGWGVVDQSLLASAG